jgi:hypothetical protein
MLDEEPGLLFSSSCVLIVYRRIDFAVVRIAVFAHYASREIHSLPNVTCDLLGSPDKVGIHACMRRDRSSVAVFLRQST